MYLNVLDACEDDVQMKSPGGMTERSICMHPGPPNSSPMALPLASALHNFFSSPEAACVADSCHYKTFDVDTNKTHPPSTRMRETACIHSTVLLRRHRS